MVGGQPGVLSVSVTQYVEMGNSIDPELAQTQHRVAEMAVSVKVLPPKLVHVLKNVHQVINARLLFNHHRNSKSSKWDDILNYTHHINTFL